MMKSAKVDKENRLLEDYSVEVLIMKGKTDQSVNTLRRNIMNKKFFAALASATMAFTASGSIAVFADDFVEENAPVLGGNDVKPDTVEETVKWNRENFGDLVELDQSAFVSYAGDPATLVKGKMVKTADLAKVETINCTDLDGEIKGLEYFTGLKQFDDFGAKKFTNKTLDFSANKKLASVVVKNATQLTGIVLPEPTVDEDEKVYYSLTDLTLENTKLTSLDLSEQTELNNVRVTKNKNLKDVTVAKGTNANPYAYDTLNLSVNSLEDINLENVKVNDTLALDENRLGVLDLSKTTFADTAKTIALQNQKLYVSETLATINVKDTFANIDTHDFKGDNYSPKTGVLKLVDGANGYTYTAYDKANKTHALTVNVEKANPMNRVYNPNSGEHFYTADIKEKEALVALGWNDEGFGWVAPTVAEGKSAKAPVFRLYNPNAGDHHYTMKAEERDVLVAYGWKYENIGWYSATGDTVEVYRQYNPYANGAGSHNYTTDKAENDHLVSLGWIYEGTAWNAKR